jgi:hypothetical protein
MSLQLVSISVLVLLGVGLIARRRTGAHAALMGSAIAVDLGMLLYIEATRHAVATVTASVSPFILIHAGLSLVVVGAYFNQIMTGWRSMAGHPFSRRAHLAVGIALLGLRLANFATGLGMVKAARSQRGGAVAAVRGGTQAGQKL